MKTIIKIASYLLLLASMVGCSEMDFDINYDSSLPPTSDDRPWGDYITTFGRVVPDANNPLVITDNNEVLFINEIDSSVLTMDDVANMGRNTGGRVLINYNIINIMETDAYHVRLNRIYDLYLGQIEVVDGEAIEGGSMSLLQDPASPSYATLGGGYINIGIEYTSNEQPSSSSPDVKLYFDSTASTEDTAIFSLVYDASDDAVVAPDPIQTKWISFACPDGQYGEIYQFCSKAQLVTFQYCWWSSLSNPAAGYISKVNLLYPSSGETGGRWMIW